MRAIVRSVPTSPSTRRFISTTAPKVAPMVSICTVWIAGIAQKWVTISMLSQVSEIHSEKSTRNVVLIHSVNSNNKSVMQSRPDLCQQLCLPAPVVGTGGGHRKLFAVTARLRPIGKA